MGTVSGDEPLADDRPSNLLQNARKMLRRAIKSGASKLLSPFGLALVPLDLARPCAWGAQPISGSFPPFSEYDCVGRRENYFIHDGYHPREKAIYFDDTGRTEESQAEIYQFAAEISDREKLSTVFDLGCGSGHKLIKYLGNLKTVGIDVPKTCEWLRARYPDRTWISLESLSRPDYPVDLVVAADVIEHLVDPDELMRSITGLHPRFIILSTPERNLLRMGTHNGPPLNPAHIREWNFVEFRTYVSQYFDVEEHFISSAPQATQCVLCRSRS